MLAASDEAGEDPSKTVRERSLPPMPLSTFSAEEMALDKEVEDDWCAARGVTPLTDADNSMGV